MQPPVLWRCQSLKNGYQHAQQKDSPFYNNIHYSFRSLTHSFIVIVTFISSTSAIPTVDPQGLRKLLPPHSGSAQRPPRSSCGSSFPRSRRRRSRVSWCSAWSRAVDMEYRHLDTQKSRCLTTGVERTKGVEHSKGTKLACHSVSF